MYESKLLWVLCYSHEGEASFPWTEMDFMRRERAKGGPKTSTAFQGGPLHWFEFTALLLLWGCNKNPGRALESITRHWLFGIKVLQLVQRLGYSADIWLVPLTFLQLCLEKNGGRGRDSETLTGLESFPLYFICYIGYTCFRYVFGHRGAIIPPRHVVTMEPSELKSEN